MHPPRPPKEFPLFSCLTPDPTRSYANLKTAGFLSEKGLAAEGAVITLIEQAMAKYDRLTEGMTDEYWSKLEMVANELIMSPFVTPDAFEPRPPIEEQVPLFSYCTLDPDQTYAQLEQAGLLTQAALADKAAVLAYLAEALAVFRKTTPDATEAQLREMLARALAMSDYAQL